ncbi:MAG: DMT family transporter [Bacteroidales bacterium]
MRLQGDRAAHLSLATATFIFGLNYVITKSLVPGIFTPLQLVFIRLGGSIIPLGIWGLITHSLDIQRKDIWRIGAAGLTGVAINQTFFFAGMARTSPLEAAIIHTANPLLVVLFASLFLGEKHYLINKLGIGVGALGALLLIFSRGKPDLHSEHFIGNLLIFINMSAYSAYMVIVKPLMRHYKPTTVMFWVFTAGFLWILPLSIPEIRRTPWEKLTVIDWFSVAYVVFFTTLLAFTLTVFGLRHLKAGTAAYYSYIQPFIAGIMGALAGYQDFTGLMLFAGILILAGAWMVSVKKNKVTAKT